MIRVSSRFFRKKYISQATDSSCSRCMVRQLSTSFQDMSASEKQRYLQTWLGNDMAGDRYTDKLVQQAMKKKADTTNAAHQLQHQQQQQQATKVSTNISVSSNNIKNNSNSVNKIEYKKTIIHQGTVRSGQQIYGEGCSVVVMGSVNDGAEVLADGDIHIYGQLHGRAVAGLDGAGNAGIFVRQFSPTLIGISDAFTMVDDCKQLQHLIGKAVYIRLSKGKPINDSNIVCIDCENNNYLLASVIL